MTQEKALQWHLTLVLTLLALPSLRLSTSASKCSFKSLLKENQILQIGHTQPEASDRNMMAQKTQFFESELGGENASAEVTVRLRILSIKDSMLDNKPGFVSILEIGLSDQVKNEVLALKLGFDHAAGGFRLTLPESRQSAREILIGASNWPKDGYVELALGIHLKKGRVSFLAGTGERNGALQRRPDLILNSQESKDEIYKEGVIFNGGLTEDLKVDFPNSKQGKLILFELFIALVKSEFMGVISVKCLKYFLNMIWTVEGYMEIESYLKETKEIF